jgi:hypothetical protein
MIVTTLTSSDGLKFKARSEALLTADEIREWERDIAWDTEELVALDETSGEYFTYTHGEWIKV